MIATPSQFFGAPIAAQLRRSARPLSPRSPTIRAPQSAASHHHSAPAAESPLPAVFPSHPPSLYDVLGVPEGAAAQEVKAAYRRLARTCHPDVASGGREGASADEFMRIHAAYATLSDPDKRADYDRKLFMLHRHRHQRPRPFSSPLPSSSRRTWETDQCW